MIYEKDGVYRLKMYNCKCADCKQHFYWGDSTSVTCPKCKILDARRRAKEARSRWTPQRLNTERVYNYARRKGILLSPKGMACVDCGKSADRYDHRDYSMPLDVVPVCGSCNTKRGPAKFAFIEQAENK